MQCELCYIIFIFVSCQVGSLPFVVRHIILALCRWIIVSDKSQSICEHDRSTWMQDVTGFFHVMKAEKFSVYHILSLDRTCFLLEYVCLPSPPTHTHL